MKTRTRHAYAFPATLRALALAGALLSLALAAALSLAPVAYGQPYSNITGNVVISSTDDVVPLSQLTFAATSTLAIASGTNITFDSGSGTTNRLTIGSVAGASFFVDDNSTLTFSNNSTSAIGGAVVLSAAGSKLYFTTAGSGSYVFNHNMTSSNGGALGITANGAIANISSAAFKNNSASNNGGAVFSNAGVNSGAAVNVSFNSVLFQSNTASQGGAFFNTGAGASGNNNSFSFINAIFLENTATGGNGGAIANTANFVSISATYATFDTNSSKSSNGGGAIFANGNNDSISVTSATFQNNTSASTGGAISAYNANGAIMTLNDVLFSNNTASTDGGAIHFMHNSANVATGWSTALYTNVSFLNNIATNGHGGAIYQTGGTTTFNVTTSATFAGNTDSGGNASSIYFAPTPNANQAIFTFNIADTATLDMRDPMTAAANGGKTLIMSATGGGLWNLGGMNTLDSTPFTYYSGTLHLYRAGEVANPTAANSSAKVAAGGLNLTSAASSFTLKGAATLLAGGGNSIAAPASTITLDTGATIALDLKGVSNTTSLLTLNAPTLAATWSTININLLNSDWLAAQVSTYTTSQTFDLLTLTGDTAHLFTDMPDLSGNFATLTGIDALTAANFTLQLNSGNNILQLYYEVVGGLTNNILDWTGANGTTWFGANNWKITGATDEAAFQVGDIVNLAPTTPAPASGTNTITITAPAPATSATVGGIFVSGNQSYALTGDGITADNAASYLTKPAATGRLVLGEAAAADGGIDPAATFAGVLDLTGQGAAINKFVNGVDIYSGALRISTTDQLGTTLSTLRFLGTTPATTGTLIIASGASLVFDGDAAAANRLSLGAGNTAAFLIEDSATLTISSNTTAAAGGAINLGGAGTLLTLAAGDNAQYVFKNNTTTGASGNGGAIALAADSVLTLYNALFLSNTASGNGGAIFGALGNNTVINLTDVSLLDNRATGYGGAIGLSGAAATTTLNINVSDDAISRFAGNTDIGGRNAISINYASAGAQSTVNINVGAGGLLDMLDPIRAMTDTANTGGAQFNKNGDGVWALAGSSTFAKWGNTGGASAGITVNQGKLYLYSADDGPVSGYPIETAKVIFVAQGGGNAASNGNAKFLFTLGSGGTLGIGGGNSLSFASTNASAYGSATIAMAKGSTLDFNFDNAKEGTDKTAMLTISGSLVTTGISIVTGGNLNPIISLDYAAATPEAFISGTYNLFSLTAPTGAGFDAFGAGATLTTALNAIRGNALFGADGISIGDLNGDGYTANFGLDTTKTILWVSFDYFTALNKVLNWTGATNGALWQTNNWVLTSDGVTGTTFANGDIVNLAPTLTAGAANTNTITLDAGSNVTAAGILVTGSQNYTIAGAGEYGIATEVLTTDGALSGAAALGKLILGAQATKTANLDTTTAFTGTLDLTQTGANTFAGGVDIYSGVLRISTASQLGTTLNHLAFLGDPAAGAAPATLQIATGQNLTFDSSLTGAENHLALLANAAGNIVLENGATLTFTSNTAANGAAINLAAGATLNLAAAPTASFLFANNTATTNGAAIYGVANSSVTLVNATFASNTAANGAALYNTSAGGLFTGTNLTFRNNTATTTGGAINIGGAATTAGATLRLDSALFDANNSNNGGAISISTGGTLVLTSATFQNNTATQRGAALYTAGAAPYYIDINGALFQSNTSGVNYANTSNLYGGAISNAAQQAAFIITSATFRDNTAIAQSTSGQGGGAIASTSPNSSFTLNNVLFQNNTVSGTGNGGAIMASTNTPFTLTDVSFLANTAQGDGNGGAIYYSGGGTLTLNVTSGAATLYADNTAGPASTPNSIYFGGTAANTLNVNVATAGNLDMLDPMAASDTTTLAITKTGTGAWNLGGPNTLGATDAATVNFTVNEGTLHLYRAGEHDTTGAHATTEAGSLTIAGATSAFTLGDGVNPATLSIAGGNTITAPTITLAQNSTLSFDLAHTLPDNTTPLLTLTAPAALNIADATSSILNFGLALTGVTATGTYNLLAADFATLAGAGFDTAAFTFYNNAISITGNYDLDTYGITGGNTLWIGVKEFASLLPHEGNLVLTWAGATDRWLGAANWLETANPSNPALVYAQGDIVNFDSTDTSTAPVSLWDTATASAIYFSGTKTYALTGTGNLVTDATSGTWTSGAATGKLVLGGSATPDATDYTADAATAFAGTLDLTALTGDPNNFKAGVDIYNGALRISTTDQLGTTLANLKFLGTAANSGTLVIKNAANILFSSAGGATNRLVLDPSTAGAFVIEDGATLAFTSNTVATSGGAISLASGAQLTLTAGAGAQITFTDNTITNNNTGAAISLAATSTLTLATQDDTSRYIFSKNIISNASASGGALYAAGAGAMITGSNLSFLDNYAGSQGGAIATTGGAASSSYLYLDNTLFQSNSSNTGGALFIAQSSTAILTTATFQDNVSNARGGAIFLNNGNSYLSVTNALFQTNTSGLTNATAGGGAAIGSASNGSTIIVTSATFKNNTARAQGGGAIALISASGATLTLQDSTFISNTAQGSPGGAIALITSQNATLNLITTTGTSTFADNTGNNAPNSIAINNTTASSTNTINVTTAPDTLLDMLDPITGTVATGNALAITKTGSGAWNLAGANSLAGAGTAAIKFAVNEGTLHLYRAEEPAATVSHTAALANINITSSAGAFTIGDGLHPATLSLGGGNTISITDPTTHAPSGAITLAQNSTLTFDLDPLAYAAIGGTQTKGTGTALLTLTAASYDIYTSGTFNFALDLLNPDLGTYNLLSANLLPAGLTDGATNLKFWDNLVTGLDPALYKYTTGITGTTLWISILDANAIETNVLTWPRATKSWLAATDANWNANAASTAPAITSFSQGDIINLSDSTVNTNIPTPAATTLNVDTLTTATIAGMYVSGTASYTITGTSITALPAIGTLATGSAATGKLTLGARAHDDAGDIDTATYTGTLTLANTSNTFTAGIEINTGALVGNDQTLGVGASGSILNNGSLTFNQLDTGTYASIIAGNGTLAKTGAATLVLNADNTTYAGAVTVNEGALLLGNVGALAASAITTASGATFGGIGLILGSTPVTIETGAALQVGLTHGEATDTTDLLQTDGNITLNDGFTLRLNINPATGDAGTLLLTGGDLTLGATGTIDLNTIAQSGSFELITSLNPFDANGLTLSTAIKGSILDPLGRVQAHYTDETGANLDTGNHQIWLTMLTDNISGTWTGATGTLWNISGSSWTNATADNVFYNGDAVTFNDTATAKTITVAAPVTAAAMTVDTAATYTFDGAPITTSTANTSITDPAIATGKLTITGSGLVILANTGTNNFEEGITIANAYGTLQGTVDTLHTGGIITDNGTLVFDQAASATFTGTILGAGGLAKQNTGNLTLSGSTGYTGFTFLNAGALTLANENQIAGSAIVFIAASSTLYTGDNAQTINALQSIEALSGGDGGSVVTGTGALTLVNQGGNATIFSGVISGAAAVIKTGSQDFALAGNNTFTGPLTVEEGLLALGNNSANGTIAQTVFVTINAGATLNLSHADANYTMSNTFAGGGNINKLDTGTLTLTANSLGFSGDTEVFGGALVLANASLGGELKLYAGAQLAGTGTLGNVTTTLGSATITIGDLNSTTAQTLALTGTLTLAGDNTLNYDLLGNGIGDRITAAALVRGVGSPYPDIINIGVNSSLSGTYTLITTTETLASIVTNNLITLSNGGTLGSRSVATYTQDANNLYLAIVTNNIAGLVWDGTAGSTWADNTPNWKTSDGKFYNGDSVVFDDTRSGTNLVNIVGAVQAVDMTVTTSGTYTFTGGAITTNTTMNSTEAAGATGALTLAATNTGLVILNNTSNTFEGGINILSGTLQGNAATLGAPTIANNSALIFAQDTSATYASAITGAGSLTKTGTGALTLSNAAYAAGLTINAGSLTLADNATSTRGNITIATGATLLINNAASYTVQNTLTGNGTLDIALTAPAGIVDFTAAANNAFAGTVKLGASTFDLSGINTTALTAATLSLGAGNTTTVGTGTQTIAGLAINGGKLIFSTTIPADLQAASFIKTTALTLGATGTIQVAIPDAVTDPATTGASLFAQSTGTTIDRLVSATTVTGAANIGSLKLIDQTGADVTASAKTAAITQNNATVATGTYTYKLDATNGLNVNYALARLTLANGSTLALTPAAGDTGAFNATISGNGNLAISTTLAPVTLGAANNFTGTTTVTAGTLIAGANNALGADTNTLTLAAGNAAYNLNGNTQTLANINSSASNTGGITLGGATGALTVTGSINTGVNSTINLVGGTLNANNGGLIFGLTGAGVINANGGNLGIASANPNLTATTNIAAGAMVDALDIQALGTGAINLLDATSNLTIGTTASGAFANTITGGGILYIMSTGTATIANANPNFYGATRVLGNALAANPAALGASAVTISSSGALTYATSGTIANDITGAGTLNLAATAGATAPTTLTGANTVSTINALAGSNIVAAAPNALGNATTNLALADNATVTLAATNATLGNVTMNGASTLGFKNLAAGNATLTSLTAQAGGAGSAPTLAFNTDLGAGASNTLNVGTIAGAYNITLANTGNAPTVASTTLALIKATTDTATYIGSGSLTFNNDPRGYLYDINSTASTGNGLDLTINRAGVASPGATIVAAAATLPLTWLAELDTISKRLGDLHLDTRNAASGMAVWMRAYTQRINVNDKDTLIPYHETQSGADAGLDYGGKQPDYTTYIGAFLGYGSASRTVDNMDATGSLTSVNAGIYFTYAAANGWYTDIVAKYNHFKNNATATAGNGPMNADYTNTAIGASLETGKRIALGADPANANWSLTPNAQAAIATISQATYTTDTGMTVLQEKTTLAQLRAGAQLAYKHTRKNAQVLQPYAKLFLANQWDTGGRVTIRDDQNIFTPRIKGLRLDAGLGVNWIITKGLQVYLDYECAFARDYTKPYGLNLGISYAW